MDDGVQELTVGGIYAKLLLEKWVSIMELREEFRYNYMEDRTNPEVLKEYASKLTSLYCEVYPKVNTNVHFKDLQKDIDKFRPHYYNPLMLIEGLEKESDKKEQKRNYKLVFELDELLRNILEKLGITKW
jgi:hypothetical protein